jgi:F-type H+-transporting ATPase subunit b
MLKKWFIISLGLLLVVQLASLSLAFEKGSREGGSSEAEEHGGSVAETLERLVNFVIFAGILYVVLRKPLVNFLDNHAERIQKALKEAKELQEEAVQKAERYQTQLLSVEEEALKIKQEAEQEALEEKKRILAEAQMQAERLMNQVKFEVDQEVKKAKEELKTFAALLAVEIAEKKLRAGLTESDQQKLVEEYIARMGNLN